MSNLWDEEPDHVLTEEHGYVVEIRRHPNLKHLCGYIYIEGGNLAGWCQAELGVHGGWTCSEIKDGAVILGFDCAHAGDLCPGGLQAGSEVYRDIPFVLNELKRVARQLKEKADGL